jgi:hypothetical protein
MKNILLTITLFLTAVSPGCTFTTTIVKPPEFSMNSDSLRMQLNKLVQCEDFSLNGAEITTNGIKETTLEIDVINGKNIPSEDEPMNALGKQIALQLKEDMANSNAYNNYKVLFVTQTINGMITKRMERGKVFKNEELRQLTQPNK